MANTPATSDDIAALTKEVHGLHNDVVYYGKQIVALLQAGGVSASVGTSPAASSGSTPAAAPSSDAVFFPSNVGLAQFPSPENSRIVRLNGVVTGQPYLLDSSGVVFQLAPVTPQNTGGVLVNGQPHNAWSPDLYFTQLIVRQGQVYAQISGGQWQHFNPAMGAFYNAALPDAYQTDASGKTTSTVVVSSVKARTLPTPMSPAPGKSGTVLTVGTGKMFTTVSGAIKAAAAGDTIVIDDGTYKETPPVLAVPLYLKAAGGKPLIDCTGLTNTLAWGKGCFVANADCHLEGLRIIGVALDQDGAQLTSGVRPDAGCGYLTLTNMEIDHCQVGLGSGTDTCIITCDGGRFHDNGLAPGKSGNGYTHNIYCGEGASLTLKNGFSSNAPNGGHAVKSRGWELNVSGGGTFDASDAAVFDIPEGTVAQATIDGVTITKPAGANNHAVIDYASESNASGNGGLLLTNTTINTLCDNPFFNVGTGSVITLGTGVKLTGTKPTAQGGKVIGL